MQIVSLQGGNKFSEIDFMLLFLSYACKKEIPVFRIEFLEKKLFTAILENDLKTTLPLVILENEEKVNIDKSINFLATLGTIACYTGGGDTKKFALLLSDNEADDIITNYLMYSKDICEDVKKISDHIYPVPKSTYDPSKAYIIRLY